MAPPPRLERVVNGGVAFWTDTALQKRGVQVAFSERIGGVSAEPYASLNLASHVGDDPLRVDDNRSRLLKATGLGAMRSRLVTAEQTHGTRVAVLDSTDVGSGAFAAKGSPPVRATDALLTAEKRLPLLLCFADCVPVVLVGPGPCVAVVHAGWRGVLGGIAATTARLMAARCGCAPEELVAYVGPHIRACHYEVGDEILSQFVNVFDTVARAESGGLDLGSVLAVSLRSAGVDLCNIASLAACTAETTDRFFSHRAEAGLTGRHGALACILS